MTTEQTLDLKIESIEDIVDNIVVRYNLSEREDWMDQLADANESARYADLAESEDEYLRRTR